MVIVGETDRELPATSNVPDNVTSSAAAPKYDLFQQQEKKIGN